MFTLTIQDKNEQQVNQVSFDQGSYTIGRMEGCDIVLQSNSVSRKHAKIMAQGGRCYIEDLGSANGVIVDGQRVVGRRDLGIASQIHIGDFRLLLEHQAPGLSSEQRVLQTVFIPRDSDHYKLVRMGDSFAGEEFTLSEMENTIGRTDENLILLSDPSISRHHAKIMREGDYYTAYDLGSSNGSSVNGKPLTTPRMLKANDQVKFGNVAFLFVPSDTRVDARMLNAGQRKISFVQLAGIGVVVLISIALGGIIVFTMANYKKEQSAPVPIVQAPTVDPVEARVSASRGQIDKAMGRLDWDGAQTALGELRALQPAHAELDELEAKIKREREAATLLDQGEELSEKGQHEEARVIMMKVPEGSASHERAQENLEHLHRTLSYNDRTEAARLIKQGSKKSLLEAHERLKRAVTLRPEDEEPRKQLDALEATLSKKKIKFTALEP